MSASDLLNTIIKKYNTILQKYLINVFLIIFYNKQNVFFLVCIVKSNDCSLSNSTCQTFENYLLTDKAMIYNPVSTFIAILMNFS